LLAYFKAKRRMKDRNTEGKEIATPHAWGEEGNLGASLAGRVKKRSAGREVLLKARHSGGNSLPHKELLWADANGPA